MQIIVAKIYPLAGLVCLSALFGLWLPLPVATFSLDDVLAALFGRGAFTFSLLLVPDALTNVFLLPPLPFSFELLSLDLVRLAFFGTCSLELFCSFDFGFCLRSLPLRAISWLVWCSVVCSFSHVFVVVCFSLTLVADLL